MKQLNKLKRLGKIGSDRYEVEVREVEAYVTEHIWGEGVNEFLAEHGNNINSPPRHLGGSTETLTSIASLHIHCNVAEKILDDMLLEFISPKEEEAFLVFLSKIHLDKLRMQCEACFAYKNADENERKRLSKPKVGRLIGRQANKLFHYFPEILREIMPPETDSDGRKLLFATIRVFLLCLREMIFSLKQQREPPESVDTREEFKRREDTLMTRYKILATVVFICLTGPLSRLSRKKLNYLGSYSFIQLLVIAPLKWRELVSVGLTPGAACEQITERMNLTLKTLQED